MRIKAEDAIYNVQRKLLSDCSPYLARLCEGHDGKNLKGGLIETQGERKDLILLLLICVYRKPNFDSGDNLRDLIDLWCLAERLEIPELQNDLLLAHKFSFRNDFPEGFPLSEIDLVYKKTKRGSKLRLYALSNWRRYVPAPEFRDLQFSLPKEFIRICAMSF